MLNIILCDSAKHTLLKLADMINKLLKDKQMDAGVKFLTLNQAHIHKAPVEKSDPCLFILEFQMENIALYQAISGQYRDASILFFSNAINAAVLKAAISGNIRPSGFIDKPIDIRELQESLTDIYAAYLNRLPAQTDVVSVAVGGRIYRLPLQSILYFESFGKKINVVTKSQCVSYYNSLQSLESAYAGSFVRCHKSYLVNTGKIRDALFSEMILIMDNEARIPVSRTYKNGVKEALEKGARE